MSTSDSRRWGWVKLPTNWIRFQRGLDRFTVRELGLSIAALKLYLAIASSQFQRGAVTGAATVARLSYSDLQQITGLSRGLIGPSLRRLDGLVEIHQGSGRATNQYALTGFPQSGGWAKLPAEYLLSSRAFAQFDVRSRADLAAMKLYLLMLALRRNRSGMTNLSYAVAAEYLAATREAVGEGKSRLVDMHLIHVFDASNFSGLSTDVTSFRKVYFVRGLGMPNRDRSAIRDDLRLVEYAE